MYNRVCIQCGLILLLTLFLLNVFIPWGISRWCKEQAFQEEVLQKIAHSGLVHIMNVHDISYSKVIYTRIRGSYDFTLAYTEFPIAIKPIHCLFLHIENKTKHLFKKPPETICKDSTEKSIYSLSLIPSRCFPPVAQGQTPYIFINAFCKLKIPFHAN